MRYLHRSTLALLLIGALSVLGCSSSPGGPSTTPETTTATTSAPRARPTTPIADMMITGAQGDYTVEAVAPDVIANFKILRVGNLPKAASPPECAAGLGLVGNHAAVMATNKQGKGDAIVVADSLSAPVAEYVTTCHEVTAPPATGAVTISSEPFAVYGMPDAQKIVQKGGIMLDGAGATFDDWTIVGTVRGLVVIGSPDSQSTPEVFAKLLEAQAAKILAAP